METDAQQVKVGQVWRDAKGGGRHLRIERLEVRDGGTQPSHARVTPIWWSGLQRRWLDSHPRTAIRLDRFRATANGYVLVSETPFQDGDTTPAPEDS